MKIVVALIKIEIYFIFIYGGYHTCIDRLFKKCAKVNNIRYGKILLNERSSNKLRVFVANMFYTLRRIKKDIFFSIKVIGSLSKLLRKKKKEKKSSLVASRVFSN